MLSRQGGPDAITPEPRRRQQSRPIGRGRDHHRVIIARADILHVSWLFYDRTSLISCDPPMSE